MERVIETWREFWTELLGLRLGPAELTFRHMAWRAAVVFAVAVFFARAGARRFLGHNAGFDIVLLVMLGSVLSRGINGEAAFFPTLGASGLLVLLHHALATLAFRWHWFSERVKGRPYVLVRDGKIDMEACARCKITRDDLDEHLRLNGNALELAQVAEARLERNGSVSVVKIATAGAAHPPAQ